MFRPQEGGAGARSKSAANLENFIVQKQRTILIEKRKNRITKTRKRNIQKERTGIRAKAMIYHL